MSDKTFGVRAACDAPIATANQFLDLMASSGGLVLLEADDLDPSFFDLKSRLAGEIMQKAVNYRSLLAVVVPPGRDLGPRFAELRLEHRTHPCVRFFETREVAEAWLRSAGAA